ncbi:MAG: hypothetical protein HY078_12030 [Elusimicrobia bacterium]|nr:hypothetical protein [Elusimicrobiota bacterium]
MPVALFGALLVTAAFGISFYVLYPFVFDARRSLYAAALISGAFALALSVPWPDNPLAAVLKEQGASALRRNRWIAEDIRVSRAKEAYRSAMLDRFKTAAAFEPGPGGGAVRAGQVAGRPAWLDSSTGLVWGAPLETVLPDYSEASWRTAKAACAAAAPEGTWALPSMAEYLKAKNAGLLSAVEDFASRRRWYATVFVPDMRLETMGLFSTSASSNASPAGGDFGVRCVARTEAAPASGYPMTSNEEVLRALNGGKR